MTTPKPPTAPGVRSWWGIPYATAERYRRPVVAGFDPDRRYDRKGVVAVQPDSGDWLEADSGMGEDCLNLNVWAPEQPAADALPVAVYIHGGGFEYGANTQITSNAAGLAASGRVVSVSVNYRLGPFGWLSLSRYCTLGLLGASGGGPAQGLPDGSRSTWREGQPEPRRRPGRRTARRDTARPPLGSPGLGLAPGRPYLCRGPRRAADGLHLHPPAARGALAHAAAGGNAHLLAIGPAEGAPAVHGTEMYALVGQEQPGRGPEQAGRDTRIRDIVLDFVTGEQTRLWPAVTDRPTSGGVGHPPSEPSEHYQAVLDLFDNIARPDAVRQLEQRRPPQAGPSRGESTVGSTA